MDRIPSSVWERLRQHAECVEATNKWFGVARHPIPYMKPGWYYIIPAEEVGDDDR